MKKNGILAVERMSVQIGGKPILSSLSLSFEQGKTYVIMGPNGSGKSTFARVLLGDPSYEVTGGGYEKPYITLDGKSLVAVPTEERAKKGMYISFQSPLAIPGVSVVELLNEAISSHSDMSFAKLYKTIEKEAAFLGIDPKLLDRGIHDGFSGGERKKIEMLEALVLKPRFAIFDEIDTGLDVDALKIVASGMKKLEEAGSCLIIITHTRKITDHIKPHEVVVLWQGKAVKKGGEELIKHIDAYGFSSIISSV